MPFLTIDNGQNCEIKLFELKEMYIKIPISLQFHKSKKKHHKNFRITFFFKFCRGQRFPLKYGFSSVNILLDIKTDGLFCIYVALLMNTEYNSKVWDHLHLSESSLPRLSR